MSAPDTDIHTQERRHRGPLGGIKAVLVFVAVLLVIYVGYLFFAADASEDAATLPADPAVSSSPADPAVESSTTVDPMPADPVTGIVNSGGPEAAGASE